MYVTKKIFCCIFFFYNRKESHNFTESLKLLKYFFIFGDDSEFWRFVDLRKLHNNLKEKKIEE